MVLPIPGELVKVEKNLNYKLFPDNTPEKVKRLLEDLQSITFRLQSLEIAYDHIVTNYPDLISPLSPLGKQLRELLQRVFRSWARFEKADALGDERATLQQISGDLERRLDEFDYTKYKVHPEEGIILDFYTLLGALKGLIEVMADTQAIISQINWGQWAKQRF